MLDTAPLSVLKILVIRGSTLPRARPVGEVVGASLAMGHALVQSLLAPGAIVSVIQCSVGAPSRVVARRSAESVHSSASLTCDHSISGTQNRFDSPFGLFYN